MWRERPGWGHHPYEDAVSALHGDLLAADRQIEPLRVNHRGSISNEDEHD
jgi:hypothetical protein